MVEHFSPAVNQFHTGGPQLFFEFILNIDFFLGAFAVAVHPGGFQFTGYFRNKEFRLSDPHEEITAQSV